MGESSAGELSQLAEKLALEEYKQLHEHIRQREGAMVTILNIAAAGGTTLLAATLGTFFKLYYDQPEKMSVLLCYLFLVPMPLLCFSLSMLSAHRDDQYRIGFFLEVFYENRFGGATWHQALRWYRSKGRRESHDPSALVIWAIALASAFAFIAALVAFIKNGRPPHVIVHALSLVPVFLFMTWQHRRFMDERRDLIKPWTEAAQYGLAGSGADLVPPASPSRGLSTL
jgi:hypothetical protein